MRTERQKEREAKKKKKISICNLFIIYRLKNTCEVTFRSVPWQYH